MSDAEKLRRTQALRDLVGFHLPVDQAARALALFPWDCAEELVVLERSDALRALERLSQGLVTAVGFRDWAQALEGRDDLGFEPGFEDLLKEFLFAASTPELAGPLDGEANRRWESVLRASGGRA
jgi:hypothetical protein